jgi:GT2 family glycosyltransferase
VRASDPVSLSVIVPTYDEADRIETCLESIFETVRAADAVEDVEVVLVDSNSTDGTVDLALEYPITVLSIPDDDLTTPGAGRYVGTHHADGDRLLFVDGDMELKPGWLPPALELVREDGVAAVDGHLNDVPDDATRVARDSVNGVALYDADALASVGGFDPFLPSLEDVHLGFELNAAGYELYRLPVVSAHHPGADAVTEPFRRWDNGYAGGTGQVLRKSLGSPRLQVKHLYRIRHRLAIAAWLGVGVAALAAGAGVLLWLLGSAVGFAAVTAVKGSPRDAAAWIAFKGSLLVGLVLGALQEPRPRESFPLERVEVVTEGPVHDGPATTAPGD